MRHHLTILILVGVAAVAVLPTPNLSAQELSFSEPQFLPGDAAFDAAVGQQVAADIAEGNGQFLAVWSDGRSSPDDYWPFATEGTGTDIFAARLDAAGNPIEGSQMVLTQAFGDQRDPRVAWNGENWLVIWHGPLLGDFDSQLQGVRVAPDGSILDPEPIILHYSTYEYVGVELAGGGSTWVALVQGSGAGETELRAISVANDGSVVPDGVVVHNTDFLMDFDIAYAVDEYLITWSGGFDAPRGRRYGTDLQPLDATPIVLPFAEEVASDGTDFLVVWASDSPPLASAKAVLVTHEGTLPNPPVTLFVSSDNQSGTCCARVAWDGTYYWAGWGGSYLARVAQNGRDVLDPDGFQIVPGTQAGNAPSFVGVPGGGLQLVWNDGNNGADYRKDVYSGRVTAAGAIDNETVVSLGAPAQLDADFAVGGDVHLVVFSSHVSGSAAVMAQRLDADGSVLDPEPIEVATGPVPGLGVPTLGAPSAAWNGELFMITWSDGLEIFARRMLADGTFVDDELLTVMDGFDPDVAAVGTVFLVVGIDLLLDNPQWQATHSMRVDGVTGANLDAQPNALGGFVIFARYPTVVGWGDRWLVVWQTNLSHDNPVAGTTAAIVNTDGTTPGVIDVPLGWRPDVAVSDDVALLVAVTGSVASATNDIDGVLMDPDGQFVNSSFAITEAADKQLRPTTTWNGTEFVVAWEDKRNSEIYFDERTDIYGARVSSAGVVLDPGGVALAADPHLPEIRPELVSFGETMLLAASIFRPEPEFCAYRLGIQESGLAMMGDLNGDNVVDPADLALLLGSWGPCPGCAPDLNDNGMVDASDLAMLLGNWS